MEKSCVDKTDASSRLGLSEGLSKGDVMAETLSFKTWVGVVQTKK